MSGQLGIDGQVQPERVCACGCKRSLEGMRRDAKWHSRACAVRWARSNPGKSLKEAHSANKGRTRRRGGRSGRQVTRDKAISAAIRTAHLFSPEADPDEVIRAACREVDRELPVKQQRREAA